VRAYEQSLGLGGILVRASDKVPETVRDAVVELGNTLALCAGDDDGVLFGVQVREVRVQDVDAGGTGVVEAGETVEFADARFDVDADFGVGSLPAGGEGVGVGGQGLEAAVEGGAVDEIDGWVEG